MRDGFRRAAESTAQAVGSPWAFLIAIGTWVGLLLDLFAPLGLFLRRTRVPMVLLLASFHLLNHQP